MHLNVCFCYIPGTYEFLKKIGEDECTDISSKLYEVCIIKNKHDLVLQGQIDAMEVHRRRPSNADEEFRIAPRIGSLK